MLSQIKSKLILKIIFKLLKKRSALKIIKCNKFIMNILNINIKDFENYRLLKELNLKFNLNISDIDIVKLNFSSKEKINEILEYTNQIEFKEIKELYLSECLIEDISIIDKINFKKLYNIRFEC